MVDADKRKYKRNKFLAYINVGAIGLTVAGALCFLPFPGMPEIVKMIMFVAGYIIWDAFLHRGQRALRLHAVPDHR